MAILPCLRYSTIPAIWNKGGFLCSYLPNGIKPVSHKFTGLNFLSQLGMFPIAFLIFERCNVKREEQAAWFQFRGFSLPLVFASSLIVARSNPILRDYIGHYRLATTTSGVGLKLIEDISCLQECSEFWEENELIILKCLAGREDLAWMNQEQAIAINWIFMKEREGEAELRGRFRSKL